MAITFNEFMNKHKPLVDDWIISQDPDDNSPPSAVADQDKTVQNAPVEIDVLENDSDPDGNPLTIVGAGKPEHGTVEIIITEDGKQVIKYTPVTDYEGQDTFTYTIGDGQGGTATATVTVTVEKPAVVEKNLDDLKGTATSPADFIAEQGTSYHYTDDITKESFTKISNFDADDSMTFKGVTADEVDVSSSGGNTDFEFDSGAGTVSHITLIGVSGDYYTVADFNADYKDIIFA